MTALPTKYHVALSFAGEDRTYVEAVATQLQALGVSVFYDRFEEDELWGKDLYVHLSNVYQKMAMYTVMFVSDAYKSKVWTNHERRNAQARAISDSTEYILPAFFDESIEVPGLTRTTGYISLKSKTPEQLAALVAKKLQKAGVRLTQQVTYAAHATADADFPTTKGSRLREILKSLKTYTWSVQNPAVTKVIDLDWSAVSPDEAFVLGRNLYQCACGQERRARTFLANLRVELASLPEDRALDLLNGMFFEVYFNKNGEFRGRSLKARYLGSLLATQSVPKFAPSIAFIRRALEPYRKSLPFVPSTPPEIVVVEVAVKKTDPPLVRSMKVGEQSVLTNELSLVEQSTHVWRLSHQEFTLKTLKQQLSDEWGIPLEQVKVECKPDLGATTKFRLPEGFGISWPTQR
ncbi:MAG: TIR domain-containing protein [Nitrospiraceae bacterium]|nr:TIR domain-containing protein [Nitrospiraceae bacterium]OQW65263.1 MAG: TIR domain-containing protein [Nitrospira sp. ST-bin5]